MTSTVVRLVRVTLAGLLAAGLLTAPGHAADMTGASVGDKFYGASFKNLKDKMESLDQYKGKVVVIYFWATWCVPCRVETPNLVKLNDAYKAKNKGVTVIGLALDNADLVRDFVKELNITYPIFYGGRDAVQLGKALGNDQSAIPFTVVIGKDGKLIHTFKGDMPNAELERIIDPLVG